MPTGLEAIVERQMRNWELGARQQPVPKERTRPHREIRPFVTISREVGGGGHTVAQKLGQRLGWNVYDREILDYMAQEDAVQRRLFALQDEYHEGFIESILIALTPEKPYQPQGYFHKLTRAIHAIARNENAIFVGRGAAFLLPAARGLRVRLVCPVEACVAHLAQLEQLSIEDAEKKVRERNKERDAYLRAHFGRDALADDNYDLMLNTASLNTESVVAVIVEALAQKTGYRA